MTVPTPHISRQAAQIHFHSLGFNRLDVECLLDLTAPTFIRGEPHWPVDRLERLAVRAYWLGEAEVSDAVRDAA